MSKPFSKDDLSNQLEQDSNWRLREISDIKAAIRNADQVSRPTLLRAYVVLLYAHWEGHIRLCTSKYFEHIALRKLPYTKLERQFYINSFHVRLDSFFRSKGSVTEKNKFMESILSSQNGRFQRLEPKLIDTQSNLNSEVLSGLCEVCGIPFSHFENDTTFIDIIILKRRNQVAHGEESFVKEDEIDELANRTIAIMRLYRNLLDNKVQLQLYKV